MQVKRIIHVTRIMQLIFAFYMMFFMIDLNKRSITFNQNVKKSCDIEIKFAAIKFLIKIYKNIF